MPDYIKAAERAARKYGVDPAIFNAMIRQESGFNPNARSPAGAQGIAQFMPGTAPGYGVNLHDNRVTDDLEGAAKYIAANLKRTGGNYHQALSIYNSGRPDGYLSIPETKNYVRTILANAGQHRVSGRGSSASPPTGSSSVPSSRTVTVTPGVDNTDARKQALASFLLSSEQDPVTGQQTGGDILSLALQMRQLQDQPAVTKTVTGRAASASSPSVPSTGGGGFAKSHSPLLELIHKSGNGGFAVKDGRKVSGPGVYGSVWDGHADHVHVAAGKKTIVEIGRLAQRMGLHVGENPHFGGVNPVHAPHSYHYRGEAIDVSGDPGKMNAFARQVERLYGIR